MSVKEKLNKFKYNHRIIKHKEGFIEYRLIAHTFRLCAQLYIGNPKENIWKQFWKDLGIDYLDDRYGNKGFYVKDETSNIIWMKTYDLGCLVHELTHLIDKETLDRGLEEEARAYLIESLLVQAQYISKNKFKVEKGLDLFV